MPAITMPSVPESTLRPALEAVRRAATECKTDSDPAKWFSDRRGLAQQLDEAYATAACRRCSHRLLCAGWAFQMEEYGTWGGFSALQRKAIDRVAPGLIGELNMIVQGLVNVAMGSTRIRPGVQTEVSTAIGEMLVARGYCIDPSAPLVAATLVEAGTQVLAEIDAIVRPVEPDLDDESAPLDGSFARPVSDVD